MKDPITCVRLAGALALSLVLLVGVSAIRADTPPPPSGPLPPPIGSVVPPPYPAMPAPPSKHSGKLHLRIPFTPVNEDGSLGRRTLITITVEGEDREQALEAADQIIDRLLVQPAVDDLWNEIDQRIQDAIHSGASPEVLPPPAPVQGPASRSVESRPPSTPFAVSEPRQVRAGVEITVEGLLQAVDGAGAALGIRSLFGSLGIPVDVYPSDPNNQVEILGHLQQSNEWQKFGPNDQPSHVTYDRIHGGIGP